MHPEQPKKRSVGAERPFPWRCRSCGKVEVKPAVIHYDAEVRHDGRLHKFVIPKLEAPVCEACGKMIVTEAVDEQITGCVRQMHLRDLAHM